MKNLLLIVLKEISIIAANIAWIWILVEFILYIAKDDPFNWNSVWLFIISCITIFIFVIYFINIKVKESKKINFNIPNTNKTKFQERLEEMAEKRGYKLSSRGNVLVDQSDKEYKTVKNNQKTNKHYGK